MTDPKPPRSERTGEAAPQRAPLPQSSPWHVVGRALYMLQVRLRFIVILLVAFFIVGQWETVRNLWDRITRGTAAQEAISPDTEYFCPMCPGVVSAWPSKCPVCHMSLVRRKKGEAAPLPDGVLARMQFSPYRLQLAGVRTSWVEFRPLVHEIATTGVVEATGQSSDPARVAVVMEVFEPDLPFLMDGQTVEMTSPIFPGRNPFLGQIHVPPKTPLTATHSLRLRTEVANPQAELRPGMSLTVKIKAVVPRLPWFSQALQDESRDLALIERLMRGMADPFGISAGTGTVSLIHSSIPEALAQRGLALAVPDTAVLDTGRQKIVYVESGPGMFDAVEVTLGPRCGEFFPVLRGLTFSQQVATAGAFLIDAETRLNPNVAAAYFGAGGRVSGNRESAASRSAPALSAADHRLALKQKFCPVTGESLDAMGGPYKVILNGKVVFLCCQGCEDELRKHPAQYLSKLPK